MNFPVQYPEYDFRSIIFQINTNSSQSEISKLVRSISREPLPELLKYWKQHYSSPCAENYKFWLQIFNDGLEQAISCERYPCFLMDFLQDYPEFYESASKGYIQLWCKLRFSLDLQKGCYQLYIGSIRGQDIFIPDQDKIRLIRLISQKLSWPMQIGEKLIPTLVMTSRKAENIYYRITWLDNKIYQQKLKTDTPLNISSKEETLKQ